MASAKRQEQLILTEIPPNIFRELYLYLDEQNAWEDLIILMKLRPREVRTIRLKYAQNQSPSEKMLRIWGTVYSQPVKSLFILLRRCNPPHVIAMNMLKKFVPQKYHKLIQIDSIPAAISENEQPASQQISASINERFEVDYKELKEATEDWHQENILGSGGFGTVYKGYWKKTTVAIKIFDRNANFKENITKIQIKQSLTELKYLNSIRHDNIVSIYGYCIRGENPCLIYEYMAGGSLESFLFPEDKNTSTLSLKQRFQICLGTACGINFLHTQTPDKPLIHGDIKPGNILLDDHLKPKIGDFGLSQEGPNGVKNVVEIPVAFGTKYYLPPEYRNFRKLSTQVDTYSFGITLFETFTGRRVYVKNRMPTDLKDFVEFHNNCSRYNMFLLMDPSLKTSTNEDVNLCSGILKLGSECTAMDPFQRPIMEGVIENLRILQFIYEM